MQLPFLVLAGTPECLPNEYCCNNTCHCQPGYTGENCTEGELPLLVEVQPSQYFVRLPLMHYMVVSYRWHVEIPCQIICQRCLFIVVIRWLTNQSLLTEVCMKLCRLLSSCIFYSTLGRVWCLLLLQWSYLPEWHLPVSWGVWRRLLLVQWVIEQLVAYNMWSIGWLCVSSWCTYYKCGLYFCQKMIFDLY